MTHKNPASARIFSFVSFSVVGAALLIAPDKAHLAQNAAGSSVVTTQNETVFRGPVVYDSGGSLGWSAAVADLRGIGKPDIVVVNYGGGPNGDGSVGVLLGNGNNTFQPRVVYDSGGGGSNSVLIADLNRDGKPDLVIANQGCNTLRVDCVGVLLGNGDGTFQPVAVYPDGYVGWSWGGASLIPMMLADINGDGKLDLLVVSQTNSSSGDGSLGVLLGNGDGTFKPVVTYDSGGFDAFSGALADVNGDGKLDVIVFNCLSTGPSGPSDCLTFTKEGIVGVLLGNGDGTFQAVKTYGSGGVPGFSGPLVVTDVNGDGKPDILVGNNCPHNNCANHGSLGVLLGNGDGTFQSVVTYDPGGSWATVTSIAVADFNHDGKLDIAVGPGMAVFFGNGNGTFQPAVVYGGGNGDQIFATDINHDGQVDLVGIGATGGTAGVLLGKGDGTFQVPQTYKLGGTQFSKATLADVNGDGKPDLVAANWCCEKNIGYEEGTVGLLLNISKSATSTTLASTLNPSIYGQKVTWTARVTSSGAIPPTGKVYFTFPGGSIGGATVNSTGIATLTKSGVNANTYALAAAYKGDTNNAPSTSPVLEQTVIQTTSSTAIKSSANPTAAGQSVTFTANVTSPTVVAQGPVTFSAGRMTLGTAQLSDGKATFTTSSLPVGSNVVKVTYVGNSNIKGSSASVIEVIQP